MPVKNDELAKPMRAAQLAELFDCSSRHIFELASRGLIVKHSAGGGFDAPASIRRYLTHLRIQAALRGRPGIGDGP